MVEQVPGLRVLVDTSHAGLYLNARQTRATHSATRWRPIARQLPNDGSTVLDYVQALVRTLENAQISNAAGVLGEGLAMARASSISTRRSRWLSEHTRHIVTETLEAEQ